MNAHTAIPVGFTPAEIQKMLDNLDQFSDEEVAEVYKLVDELEKRQHVEACQKSLIEFCKHMQQDYKVGAHHRKLATLLEDIERGRKDRICVSVPPRHGKSQMVSIYYAAWYLGRNPAHKVMLVSHTTDLAVDFGRKVRNLIATDEFREIFPGVELAKDSKSAGRWNTTDGGEFYATGVGSALAGRGAHLLLIDDPHSEQDILNGNLEVFAKAYEWYAYGARTRLMPGGRVAIVHCMTGDTQVLRPDGSETPLCDIRPGDMVASYENGQLVSRKVLNWANQGSDAIFTISIKNGNSVRANARHPFLVVRDGVETWVKVRDLKVGDSIVSIIAEEKGKLSQNQAFATDVSKKKLVEKLAPRSAKTITTLAKPAQKKAARGQQYVKACADHTTTWFIGRPTSNPSILRSSEITIFGETMASASPIMTPCWSSRGTGAVSATNTKILSLFQRGSVIARRLWSTTATVAALCERCCATGVTSLFKRESLNKPCSTQFSTSEITAIVPDGREDVFDIQVEGTENFIANGVVSHNTRWHQDDLIGRVVRDMTKHDDADQFEVFEFPAILEVNNDDGSTSERALWPEFFDLPALKRTKASMPVFQWESQYQQNPTGEEAAIIKREWWRRWTKERPPPCEFLIMSLDAAAEKHNRADFTALTTWGVFFNEEENMHSIILLNAIKERLEFPELKQMCLDEYRDWQPDSFIVEKKSAGTAIYQELRRMGIAVQEYTPHRGTGDKHARLNSVTDMVSSGMVWVPDTRWAEQVVEEIAGFPYMAHDDLVDSTVMALMRFRQGGFVRLPTDEEEYELPYRPRVEYY